MALSVCISLYIALTVVIGIYASKMVHSSTDYCLAGRKLPLLLCSSTMFSTWFGSETIVGASAEFIQHGFLGVIEDPFGTALCFILIGVLIAKPIYKLRVTTIVDFFRIKFGSQVERISAVFMILSYIGWIAAQFLAMAIILNVILHIPVTWGVLLSTAIVCLYTIFGGMWSISINDFIQTTVIVAGLLFIGIVVYQDTNPIPLMQEKLPRDFFNFFPEAKHEAWIKYITAWLTIGLGSIPQQDVFQRVMSARSEKVAVHASYISALLYVFVGSLPLFVALAFKLSDPSLANLPADQLLLQAIMQHDNLAVKVLFFGALLSAIMSSASGAILAPATILGENLIKPLYKSLSDDAYLRLLKISVLATSLISGAYAAVSSDVYALVAESSIISLVSLFIPLVAGIYWSKANAYGATLSIFLGPLVWGLCLYVDQPLYGGILGFAASIVGMLGGNMLVNLPFLPKISKGGC